MFSRRLFLALALAVPTAAKADTVVYRFGRWYRVPDPDEGVGDGWFEETPSRIRRPPTTAEPATREPARPVPESSSGRIDDGDAAGAPLEIAPHAREEAIARRSISPIPRKVVAFEGYAPGTIVISTGRKRLHLVLEDGVSALRYGVGVGREGFSWKGTETISAKREWPDWTPPAEMRARDPKLPVHMDGGLANPLGARALYLGETLYRIHGTNEPSSIGRSVSSGCIRLANADIIDLYGRVEVGATVVVL